MTNVSVAGQGRIVGNPLRDFSFELARVTRRQHGRGGPSLSEELLLRHPNYAWCANVHYSCSVWNKLKALGLVTGAASRSRLTSSGYAVREGLLAMRRQAQ